MAVSGADRTGGVSSRMMSARRWSWSSTGCMPGLSNSSLGLSQVDAHRQQLEPVDARLERGGR